MPPLGRKLASLDVFLSNGGIHGVMITIKNGGNRIPKTDGVYREALERMHRFMTPMNVQCNNAILHNGIECN